MGTKKLFTPEEVAILRANKYALQVTAERIPYTLAFKERFWELRLMGRTGIAAFRALGYDPEVLGLACSIRKANPYRRMAKAIRTGNIAENLVKREFEEHGPQKIEWVNLNLSLTRSTLERTGWTEEEQPGFPGVS